MWQTLIFVVLLVLFRKNSFELAFDRSGNPISLAGMSTDDDDRSAYKSFLLYIPESIKEKLHGDCSNH